MRVPVFQQFVGFLKGCRVVDRRIGGSVQGAAGLNARMRRACGCYDEVRVCEGAGGGRGRGMRCGGAGGRGSGAGRARAAVACWRRRGRLAH